MRPYVRLRIYTGRCTRIRPVGRCFPGARDTNVRGMSTPTVSGNEVHARRGTVRPSVGTTTPVRKTRVFRTKTRTRRVPVPIDLRAPSGRLLPF